MDKKPSKLLKWLEEIYPSEEKGNFITKLAGKTGIPNRLSTNGMTKN